jgi:vacuolar-type H+-ATPase subunit E/Vma4
MPLLTDFRDLGYELAQFIKKEIEDIKNNAKDEIEKIKSETERKIKAELISLENELLKEAEFEINRDFSNRVNQINTKILEAKNSYINSIIQKLDLEISNKIHRNPDGYRNYLSKLIREKCAMIESNCWLYCNQEDHLLFQKFPDLLKDAPYLELNKVPIDTKCGFKIVEKSGAFEMDFTHQSLIKSNWNNIAQLIMSFLPIFSVSNADLNEILTRMRTSINQSGDNNSIEKKPE